MSMRVRAKNSNTQSSLWGPRAGTLVVALVLGWILIVCITETWGEYWLLKDAQEGTAVVIARLPSGRQSRDHRVAYSYAVNGKTYKGQSGRNYEERYQREQPGEKSVVYYSASHPWISSLSRPQRFGLELLFILFLLACETKTLLSLIYPQSKRALHYSELRP